MKANDVAGERGTDEALGRFRVVLPADLERDQPLVAKIDRLHLGAALEIPEMEPPAVLAVCDVGGVETVQERVRGTPFAGDERVLPRLVPEVIHELLTVLLTLPALRDREVPRIEHGESAGEVAVGIAEHRYGDDVAGHAVDRMRRAQAELLLDLLALDHVLDPWRAGLGDVEDVDP